MTRINSWIEPVNLSDNHLIAEIKEINQLCGSYNVSLNSKTGIPEIPKQFTLGKGHVTFFMNKGLYLHNRFDLLKQEAIKRGFNIVAEFNKDMWKTYHYKDYTVDIKEKCRILDILYSRIKSNSLTQKNDIRYYKEKIDYNTYIKILVNEKK